MQKSHLQRDHLCITSACWGLCVEKLDLCVHSRLYVEEVGNRARKLSAELFFFPSGYEGELNRISF